MKDLRAIASMLLVNVLIYGKYWAGSVLFTGKDTVTQYMPLINFETDCLQQGSYPLWNPFINFGIPYVEHVLNSALFPTHLLMGLVTGSSMLIYQRDLLLWIFLGGLGIYLCVREFGLTRMTAVVTGISFMFSGQLLVLPSWGIIIYNACCFPYWILGYHRAKRYDTSFSLLSIIFIAIPVFSGYVSSYVQGVYYFIGYVIVDSLLSKRLVRGLLFLAINMSAAFLIALPKLLPVYSSMGNYERMSVAEANANPDEIIGYYNLMSLFLPVKYYFSVYIGQLSMIALLYGMVKKTIRFDALLIMSFLSAWFLIVGSDGTFSILHKIANSILPMMRLTRNEWMYWNYPLTFVILYIARDMDAFLGDEKTTPKMLAVGSFAALLIIMFFSAYNVRLHSRSFLVHLSLAAGFLLVGAAAKVKKIQTVLLMVLIFGEFLMLVDRVSVDEPYVQNGENIHMVLTHQVMASESFRDNELVRQRMPIVVLDDKERPSVSDSRKWPYLLSGLDGNFVDNLNQKRFSGWWYNTQERADFVMLKNTTLPDMDEVPLFAFFGQADGQPVRDAISFDGISCSGFDFRMSADKEGFFLLHQMYDDRWNVYVDGIARPIERANGFFLGVAVPPGSHVLTFRFRDPIFLASCAVSLLTLLSAVLLQARAFIKCGKSGCLPDKSTYQSCEGA